MKETIRENIKAAYSLHDQNIIAFDPVGEDLILRPQSGDMIKVAAPSSQVVGYVKLQSVQWDFCYAYLMETVGNAGEFTGEKMSLREFMDRFPVFGFLVMDETYGYNMTKYSGYLTSNRRHCECMIEIYHEDDMIFVDETKYDGMREVVLSHDSNPEIYLVPAEVAADLEKYCWDFAANWVWHGPENGKYLKYFGEGQLGAVFGSSDFIAYLNEWVFPACKSELVKILESDEIPEEYQKCPRYHF